MQRNVAPPRDTADRRAAEVGLVRMVRDVPEQIAAIYQSIDDVAGPDEWHTGVRNNFFTNYLAAWTLREARRRVLALRRARSDGARSLT